jgi:hypothetical protein
VPSLDTLLRLAVAAILLWAAASKLTTRPSPRWLGAVGVTAGVRGAVVLAAAVGEATVAALLLAGVAQATYGAIGLGAVFVVALAVARARGVRRLECGCFGAKERSTLVVLARALAFTAFAALAAVHPPNPSQDTAVVIALVTLSLAVVVLAGLVLALYRQVGILTLRLGPGVALELAEEGPPLGDSGPDLAGLTREGAELAVFFSPDCRLCRQLAPAVRALAYEGLSVRVVYEHEEPDAFERWRVPGSPFAVHLVSGTVTAKGTVNTLEQLEELVALGAGRMERAAA